MSDVNCGSCSETLPPSDGVKCETCNTLYHSICVGVQTETSASPWRCKGCKEKDAKEKQAEPNSVASWYETTGAMVDMELRLRHMTNQLRMVRNQFREFRQKLQRIRILNSFLDTINKRRARIHAQRNVRHKLRPVRKFRRA